VDAKEYKKLVTELRDKAFEISLKKSHDYADDEDVLGNFKRVSAACKALNINSHEPYGFALSLLILKIDRINNLVSRGIEPENESVEDSFIDDHNYTDLTYACIIDKHMKNKIEELIEGENECDLS